mmetsp:Transcript_64179/g.150646  ORF Transcript_64179/g.150646 Transcript_64179/m.150646 type:complete len:787 (+) Transcript_64179:78-2438(+)
MGSATSVAGLSQLRGLVEYFSVGPADLPAALQPLLNLSLTKVCAVYHRFGGEDSVPVEAIAEQLRWDMHATKVLTAGQKCLPTVDLLFMLILASRTHSVTKARLIFDVCDLTGQGYLQLEEFFQATSSFLRAAMRLGSGTRRPEMPSQNVLDTLAFSMFRSYDPEMSKDAFIKWASSQDLIGRLLRRFARGAIDEAFHIRPRRELVASKAHENEAKPSTSALRTVSTFNRDVTDAPLPRRKGYFLAVQSSREVALCEELEYLKRERANAEKPQMSALDVELREREIRQELASETNDEVARREYRRRLQKVWHRSRPNSANGTSRKARGVVCQRRLWTASSYHVACGGILPAGVPRPITPSQVQAVVNSIVSSSTNPSRTIEERVRQEFSSQGPLQPKGSIRSRRDSLVGTQADAALGSETVERETHFRKADVLLAFTLYREEYWLREGAGMRSLLRAGLPLHPPKDMTSLEAADRRREEVDLMLQEVAQEKVASCTSTAPLELSLRGFFKAVFPFAKKSDLQTMMHWVKHPPIDDRIKARQLTSVRPDLGLLRDLIDLFDAIDSSRTQSVPVAAVEQFLSGEIITQGESSRLRQRRQLQTNQRSVTNAACYPHNPRVALILSRMLEDRADWQVTLPVQEGIQKREAVAAHAWKFLEHKMESLASTLDEELRDLAQGDENLLTESIEAACNPWHHDENMERVVIEEGKSAPGAQKVRLVRLYWRYMIGSAIVQQMRDEPSRLTLKDGKLDLLGFMCVLAQDQVRAIFPLSRPMPSEAQLRRFAYAYD